VIAGIRMTRVCRGAALLIAALLAWPAMTAYAVDPTELSDPALQARYRALTHELRCMQCQNQSIADSPVGLAADLRREVRDMLLAGKSDAEIREFMVARYGDFILFRPRVAARTAWLWAAPPLLLALGVVIAVRIVRRRSALAANDDTFVEDDADASR
jgi:cytochrome c-type biogenesis protein CcmH